MTRFTRIGLFWTAGIACLLLTRNAAIAEGIPDWLLISLDKNGDVLVEPMAGDHVDLCDGTRGLVIWSEADREYWEFLSGHWTASPKAAPHFFQLSQIANSRGVDRQFAGGSDLAVATTLLPQVRLPDVVRATGSIVTPYDGAVLLRPRITFRREISGSEDPLPEAEGILLRGETELARIRFPKTVAKLCWANIPDLPPTLQNGLPPGVYQFRLPHPTGLEAARFTVLSAGREGEVLNRSKELAALLNDPQHPLALQVAVEEMLACRPPCLADVMDLLEGLPSESLTTHLRALRRNVAQRLTDPGAPLGLVQAYGEPTGDSAIDEVRALIASAAWDRALEAIDEIEADDVPAKDQRRRGLAVLYRAVVFSESGPGRADEATAAFHQAIGILSATSGSSDLYRAYSNAGNFFLGRAQDQLYNHAFQMAAGCRLPLVTALTHWREARGAFEHAVQFAVTADRLNATRLDLARLYATLADIVRTLRDPDSKDQGFPAAEDAASTRARALASEAIKPPGNSEPDGMIRAVGEELLSQLALRDGDLPRCKMHAEQALANYVDI